jgi:GT2 family glycosyltransferase
MRDVGPTDGNRAFVAVGAIVVNWRNAPDTLQCLESLCSARPRPFRVVVVDNGSGDRSAERFAEWASLKGLCFDIVDATEYHAALALDDEPLNDGSWLTIVRVAKNLGFAGGNNVGLTLLRRDARLTHFLLLNNDALVASDYFSKMQSVLDANPKAGLCIGTIYEFGDRSRVWYAGGRMRLMRALASHELLVPPSDTPKETEFVTGCAMVISRGALDEVGLLPECYFPGYMEDAEYSWRIRAAGFVALYAPRAVIYHKVGASFGAREVSPFTEYYQNRHRLYFVRRNLRGVIRLAALAYMIITKPGRAFIHVLQGRAVIGWATLRGTWAGLTTRPIDVGRSWADGVRFSSARNNATL